MKRELLFNKDGVYSSIVYNNLLMHREATQVGTQVFKNLYADRREDDVIKVLDLACGGLPISVSEMMENVPNATFSYTGIDINPDQVECASNFFQFPENVIHTQLLEANAWELTGLDLEAPFDLIFTGLNLHHATPEEIDYLMTQVAGLLHKRGVFLNHDWFRPDTETYVRRPSVNPDDENESFLLVSAKALDGNSTAYGKPTNDYHQTDPEWRLAFINGLTDSYWYSQNDEKGANTLKSHMLARDYPVSRADLGDILKRHGYNYKIVDYHNEEIAICPFMAMPFACKDPVVYQKMVATIQ